MDQAVCPGCQKRDGFREIEKIDSFRILRCGACDLEFSEPMRSPGGNWYDKAYLIRHSSIDTRVRDYYQWAVRSLPEAGKLLDVGCGEGVFVAYAKKHGFDAYGIDFSYEAISLGKKWFGLNGIYNCSLSELMKNLDIPDFDAITFFEVLEHLDNPSDFLTEIKKALKSGGYVALSVPLRDRWPVRDFGDYPPNHLTRWSKESLRKFFESNGFAHVHLEETSRFRSYHFFLGYLIRVLVYKMFGMYAKGFNSGPVSQRAHVLEKSSVKYLFSTVKPRLVKDIILWPLAALTYPLTFPWFRGNNLMLVARKS